VTDPARPALLDHIGHQYPNVPHPIRLLRPRRNTLGQGVTGTIRGTWQISGNAITLTVSSAPDARLADASTKSTIEKFEPDEIVVKSDKGDMSTFRRLL
jgi:hypothetical protein